MTEDTGFISGPYESGNEDPSKVCVNPRSSVWVRDPLSTSGDQVVECTYHSSYDAHPCEIISLDIRKDEQQYAQKAEDRTKDTTKYHQHSQACEPIPWMDDAVWFTIQLATPNRAHPWLVQL